MPRLPVPVVAGLLALAGTLVTLWAQELTPDSADPAPDVRWARAETNWQHGDYPAALDDLFALVDSPAAAPYVERIAALTGEQFVTAELTTDGRNPALSADGTFASYETGPSYAPTTAIWRVDGSEPVHVADLDGGAVAFHPRLPRLAWIRPSGDSAWREAVDAVAAATGPGVGAAMRRLAWLLASEGDVVIRDLATGRDTVLPTADVLKRGLVWAAEDEVAFIGSSLSAPSDVQVYVTGVAALTATALTNLPGFKEAIDADPAGRVVLVRVGTAPSFVSPDAPRESLAPANGTLQPGSTIVLHRGTGNVDVLDSVDVTLSADGSTLAWIEHAGDVYRLRRSPIGAGETTTVREDGVPMQGPALSPNGSLLAYARREGVDWDIFVWSAATGHQRVTDDLQHDLLPRFLTETTLTSVRGEPRHRRAIMHELDSGRHVRLFANNTIRTISPEYAWAPSANGRTLAIQADRDGDTISPERSVSVVHLDRVVVRDDLLARLRRQREAEAALRTAATTAFDPITAEIRRVVDEMDADRVRQHIESLAAMGSRYVTRPGNRTAIDYLAETFRAAGYDPELQWFQPGRFAGVETANVVAVLPGTASPDVVYLLTSHFDSVEAGPGADDDASGIAALLEVARQLAASPMPATIMFGALSGEEAGLLGARELARRLTAADTAVRGVLNNDMIGWGADRPESDNTIRYANAAIRDLQHGAALLFTDLLTYDARYYRGTDAGVFYETWGEIVGGFGSHPVLGNPHYHQPTDTADTVSVPQVVETAKATAGTLMVLASSPAPVRGLAATPAAGGIRITWDAAPESDIVGYAIAVGPAGETPRLRQTTTGTAVDLENLSSGDVVAVRPVNLRQMPGWDWSTVVVP